jgi:hypothetical protein
MIALITVLQSLFYMDKLKAGTEWQLSSGLYPKIECIAPNRSAKEDSLCGSTRLT